MFTVALIVRVGVSIVFVDLFDKPEFLSPEAMMLAGPEEGPMTTTGHQMIKTDPAKFYYRGNEIARQIRSGVNPFVAGTSNVEHPLMDRLVAAYALTTNKIQVNPNGTVPTGQVLGFLLVTSVIYAVSVAVFLVALTRIIPYTLSLVSAGFLAIEPTFVQYSASFWTESVFVSILMIAISAWIYGHLDANQKAPRIQTVPLLITGAMLGLAYLQRPSSIGLVVVFIIASVLVGPRSLASRASLTRVTLICAPFVMTLLLLGAHNYFRVGVFYFTPPLLDLPKNFAAKVLADVNHTDADTEWATIMRSVIAEARADGALGSDGSLTERQSVALTPYLRKATFNVAVSHPIESFVRWVKNATYSLRIRTNYVYFKYVTPTWYSKYSVPKPPGSYRPYRLMNLLYTVAALISALIGWFFARRFISLAVNALFVLVILYFAFVSGWMPQARFTVPNIVVYSVYWGIAAVLAWRVVKGSLLSEGAARLRTRWQNRASSDLAINKRSDNAH